jgi:hypothetical protein
MNKKFSTIIYSNFNKNQGSLIGAISLIASIILWVFKPETVISFGLVLFLLILTSFLIIIFADSGYGIFVQYENLKVEYEKLKNKTDLPNLIKVIKRDEKQIVLARPSKIFSHDMIVSLYFIDTSGIEELIGFGSIINIQESGVIQIEIIKILENFEELFGRMINNDMDILKNTIIKPHFSMKFIDIINND